MPWSLCHDLFGHGKVGAENPDSQFVHQLSHNNECAIIALYLLKIASMLDLK